MGRTKGGILTLVKNTIPAKHYPIAEENLEAEVDRIIVQSDDRQIIIYNYYCPNDKNLSLHGLTIPEEDCLVIGDFNSHSPSWGYDQYDTRGEEVEIWQISSSLQLLNNRYDHPTFYSRTWKTTSTPDLAFATNNLACVSQRDVLPQLGGSDHRPIRITVEVAAPEKEALLLPRWNFKKANWEEYRTLADRYTAKINVKSTKITRAAKEFTATLTKAALESIPRGARKHYNTGQKPLRG